MATAKGEDIATQLREYLVTAVQKKPQLIAKANAMRYLLGLPQFTVDDMLLYLNDLKHEELVTIFLFQKETHE